MENVRMEYFTAGWCGPCRAVRPVVEQLQQEGWNIEKVDIDADRPRAKSVQILGVPTFIIYKDDVVVRRFTGARNKAGILAELNFAAQS